MLDSSTDVASLDSSSVVSRPSTLVHTSKCCKEVVESNVEVLYILPAVGTNPAIRGNVVPLS